jgi:4-aminobutyrate aminotransferase-like enzyme/Ser/Thr protein kinase RdoA (MazF antagonist)
MDPATDAPKVKLEDAAALAASLYGLDATVRSLPSYRDANFALEVKGKPAAVLKIVHPDTPPRRVAAWLAAHEAAEASDDLPVPQILSDTSGGLRSTLRLNDGRTALVYAISWLEGENLGSIEPSRRPLGLWRQLGRALAQLGDRLAAIDTAALDGDPRWELSRAAWTLDYTHLHEDLRRRELVEGALLQFLGTVRRRESELPIGVIHGDANDHNLLVDGEISDLRLSGILDFGDLTRSARIYELAIAGAYAVFGAADPVPVLVELVEGWCEVSNLTATEIDVLPAALAARLAVSVTSSEIEARERPDDEYLLVSRDGAWRALEILAPFDRPGGPSLKAPLARAAGLDESSLIDGPGVSELRERRARLLPRNQSLSYREPIAIMRGSGCYLYDGVGRAHLDCVNNVAHVGHAHPQVVAANAEQNARLNTNTRYLHPTVLDYAERLLATFPDELEVVTFVNSGSEANELALRMARAASGRRDCAVLDWAYHGHTSALIDLSPYKHARRGGQGAPDWVHVAPLPDLYRGRYRRRDDGGGETAAIDSYLRDFEATLDAAGEGLAAFFAESIPSCGGQIVLPERYLARAHEAVRARGGLCVADEVQVGFGRVGRHWWAFQAEGVVPDIVTLGKPIGDGHPMAAVVTTRAVADAFANGMEYFATFGGNPVSAATGLAVLEVIDAEGLRQQATEIGDFLIAGFQDLAVRFSRLGEVRGRGLFLGLEFVRESGEREADPELASAIVEHLRRIGILLSTDGPDENVIKIKPPLVFGRDEARLLLKALERALIAETASRD